MGPKSEGSHQKIQAYSKRRIGEFRKKEEEVTLFADLLNRKTFIQTELLRLLEEEETYWHKISNSMWLLKGNNNTAFFHSGKWKEKEEYNLFS